MDYVRSLNKTESTINALIFMVIMVVIVFVFGVGVIVGKASAHTKCVNSQPNKTQIEAKKLCDDLFKSN